MDIESGAINNKPRDELIPISFLDLLVSRFNNIPDKYIEGSKKIIEKMKDPEYLFFINRNEFLEKFAKNKKLNINILRNILKIHLSFSEYLSEGDGNCGHSRYFNEKELDNKDSLKIYKMFVVGNKGFMVKIKKTKENIEKENGGGVKNTSSNYNFICWLMSACEILDWL